MMSVLAKGYTKEGFSSYTQYLLLKHNLKYELLYSVYRWAAEEVRKASNTEMWWYNEHWMVSKLFRDL